MNTLEMINASQIKLLILFSLHVGYTQICFRFGGLVNSREPLIIKKIKVENENEKNKYP